MDNSILNLKKDLFDLIERMKNNNFTYDGFKTAKGVDASFDNKTNEVMLQFEVQGTQFEGRGDRIESLKENDSVIITREPDNKYNENNLTVTNSNNMSLGNVPSEICNIVSPLIDKNYLKIISSSVSYVEPLSKRSARCKKALLYVRLVMKLKEITYSKGNSSIICLLGGDHTRCWVQELRVLKCDIPFADALKLFELHNRFYEEYKNYDYGYLGLDHLAEEVEVAREKMKSSMKKGLSYNRDSEKDNFLDYAKERCSEEPDRYSSVEKYINKVVYVDVDYDFVSIFDIFDEHKIEEEDYYWEDYCRITKEEFLMYDGFNHWYEIMELYNPEEKLPFDLEDEDVISIFGFNEFASFADLSYGC